MTVDSLGFRPDRFPEILSNIEGFQKANISKPFTYTDDKVIYQLNSIFASRIDSVAKAVEEVVANWRLSEASGVWLDGLALLRGVPRIQAQPSFTSSQYLYMVPGSTLPAGSLFKSSISTRQAYNIQEVFADSLRNFGSVCKLKTSIASTPDGEILRVTINGIDYSVSKEAGDTAEVLLTKLSATFDLDTSKTWDYVVEGLDLIITPTGTLTLSVITYSTLFTIALLKMYTTVYLQETGAISVPAMTVDGLVNPLLFVDRTNNDQEFILGNDKELDEDLRFRIAQGPSSDATGTVLAIERNVLTNTQGVTLVKVVENTGDVPLPSANGRFGGFETLVVGGTNEDVAKELFRNKGAGIPTYGNTVELIIDDKGNQREVKFSRATAVPIAFRVSYSVYEEEPSIEDAIIRMRVAIVENCSLLGIGEDVIPTRFYSSIYSAASTGIGNVSIEVQKLSASGEAPVEGSWTPLRLGITDFEYPTCNISDVYVNEVS